MCDVEINNEIFILEVTFLETKFDTLYALVLCVYQFFNL